MWLQNIVSNEYLEHNTNFTNNCNTTVVTGSCTLAILMWVFQLFLLAMSLLQHFKLRDCLPDPKGPLCNSVVSNVVAMVTGKSGERDHQEEETWPAYKMRSVSQVWYLQAFVLFYKTEKLQCWLFQIYIIFNLYMLVYSKRVCWDGDIHKSSWVCSCC